MFSATITGLQHLVHGRDVRCADVPRDGKDQAYALSVIAQKQRERSHKCALTIGCLVLSLLLGLVLLLLWFLPPRQLVPCAYVSLRPKISYRAHLYCWVLFLFPVAALVQCDGWRW